MNEVSSQTVMLLIDALAHRGVDVLALWAGMGIDIRALQQRPRRVDWEIWVEMMARAEAACGEEHTERLFVPGAGARANHGFVQLANAFLSVDDVFALFARWGLSRSLMVISAKFDAEARRFRVTIDRERIGSLPTLRFIVGVLRSLPSLQGLPFATVELEPGATTHTASYALGLPQVPSLRTRARRLFRVARGATAALDELEEQAAEIASKNAALTRQLAETERAAAALREREEWLALALAAGQVGIWEWHPQTGRVRLSEGLGELLGFPGQLEIEATAWTARIHPDDREPLAVIMRRAIEAGSPFEAEYRISRASGDLAWIHVKGRVIGHAPSFQVLGTVVDISEKKLLDGRLRLADRLIAAGTMAAGVAHEINNPLSFVLGNVELVRMQLQELPNVDQGLHDAVDRMLDGLDRIRAVVADLRTFARPEEDLVTRVELAAVCDAALRVVASTIRHRASLSVDHAADTPAVIANSSRLGQVIINLIVNASDAMADRPDADNRIQLRTRRLATGEAVIEVADNGAGIASAILPQLFDPFFTTKGMSEGTGLGLAVCQSIVASMHGRIEVESTPGRGATFSVVLPAAPPQLEPATPVVAAAAPNPPAGRRVLVIDDEPMLRNVLALLLPKLGYEMVGAASGQRGIELACNETFDVVLCDLMMPDVDGVAVHDEVLGVRPDVARRMVFITGGPVTDRARTFAERTDIRLLAKPFSIATLVEAIERVER